MAMGKTEQVPIQPVAEPILCNPYEEPTEHWVFDETTGEAKRFPGRREASYWYRQRRPDDASSGRRGTQKLLTGFTEEQREPLDLVNRLRSDVRRWRDSRYEGATPVTKQLMAEWNRPDRPRRLFFCQREAVETIIYLAEIRLASRRTRFNPAFTDAHLDQLADNPADANDSVL